MLSYPEAPRIFVGLKRVVIDENPMRWPTAKRGDQLALGLARLMTLAPGLRMAGLSATVENPSALAQFMGGADVVVADPGPPPRYCHACPPPPRPPWSGAGGAYAARDVLAAIREARLTLVFINTRAQAELFFQALWAVNERQPAHWAGTMAACRAIARHKVGKRDGARHVARCGGDRQSGSGPRLGRC